MHETAVADRAGIAAGGSGGGIFAAEWRDGDGGSARTPRRAYVTGMAIALSAIAMFFVAIVSAAVVRRGAPSGDWQPLRAGTALWQILSLNTIVLVASSLTLMHSRSRARAGDTAGFQRWWLVTCALGVCFLAGQLLAWRQLVAAGLYLATNPSSSFFYLITAAHGVHLAGGIIALLVVAFRRTRKIAKETALEVASMYWHAMDAIWIFLFLFLMFGGRA
jgi:cytochrome c oxidase subunit III